MGTKLYGMGSGTVCNSKNWDDTGKEILHFLTCQFQVAVEKLSLVP